MWEVWLLIAFKGYLLGSIPTGYLVGRMRGIDIREHGSRNIGATNVVRVLGKPLGALVFVCDALKGWLAVWIGKRSVGWYIAHTDADARLREAMAGPNFGHLFADFQNVIHYITIGGIIGALACILGHNFPVWLRFKGGKGIATSAGALLGLMPLAVGIAAVVWMAAFYALRYVSVASMLAAAALPIAVLLLWVGGMVDSALIWFSLLAAVLAVWRHRSNIQRLLSGTEPRFTPKSKTSTSNEPAPDDAAGSL